MFDSLISRFSEALYILPIYFISLTLHEFSHGFVAYKLGDPTAKDMGRLSLNPFRHVDIVGLIMMVLIGFGWAKPVPVNPLYFRNPRKGMMFTALAGPVSNFALAFVTSFMAMFAGYAYSFTFSEPLYYVYHFFMLMAFINIGLAIFNLIPVHPLDGSRVLGYFLPNSVNDFFVRYGNYIYIAFFVLVMATDVVSNVISVVQGYVFTAFGFVLDTPAYLLASLIFS